MGYSSTGDGTATVTGTDSSWTNSAFFYVGRSGMGTLNVEAGGSVSGMWGYMGLNSASNGTVTVTGTDSSWTNSAGLAVGRYGTGTLNVAAGGSVSSNYGYLGYYSTGDGTATVTGTDSSWDSVQPPLRGPRRHGHAHRRSWRQCEQHLGLLG